MDMRMDVYSLMDQSAEASLQLLVIQLCGLPRGSPTPCCHGYTPCWSPGRHSHTPRDLQTLGQLVELQHRHKPSKQLVGRLELYTK